MRARTYCIYNPANKSLNLCLSKSELFKISLKKVVLIQYNKNQIYSTQSSMSKKKSSKKSEKERDRAHSKLRRSSPSADAAKKKDSKKSRSKKSSKSPHKDSAPPETHTTVEANKSAKISASLNLDYDDARDENVDLSIKPDSNQIKLNEEVCVDKSQINLLKKNLIYFDFISSRSQSCLLYRLKMTTRHLRTPQHRRVRSAQVN